MSTYYLVLANDGVEVSNPMKTLKQARQEMRDIIKEDEHEFGLAEGDIDYYIVKCVEKNGTVTEEEIR